MITGEPFTEIQYPSVNLSHGKRAVARVLINGYYTRKYGRNIRYETPVSIRVKILEIESHMDPIRHSDPTLYKTLARQCVDMERVCQLLEILR